MLDLPLDPAFRYIHGPLRSNEQQLRKLGDKSIATELRQRIQYSSGGTFLVTGFRGVGKSTLVMRALNELARTPDGPEILLPVLLNVARSTTTDRLLFAIVRRVFEELNDSGLFDQLPHRTKHALLLSYIRTSLSFKESRSDARERTTGMELSKGGSTGIPLLNLIKPKMSMSTKRSRSLAEESAFLAYSETDVEHDLLRIVSLINHNGGLLPQRGSWWRKMWRRQRPKPSLLRVVIVLDEVDKLTSDPEGMATVEELLSGMKNVLTSSGMHFLVVAGPELHDHVVLDSARGNSVYESVFGWRTYVPCDWACAEQLIAQVVPDRTAAQSEGLDCFVNYLRFKARGIPRRLHQEFNRFVTWRGAHPCLSVSAENAAMVEFYAWLEQVLDEHFNSGSRRPGYPLPIDEDRWRLGGYYVVDWVLLSEGRPFGTVELLRQDENSKFDPVLQLTRHDVDRLLRHLVKRAIVEVVSTADDSTGTVIGDVPEAQATTYRLTNEILDRMRGLSTRDEAERPVSNHASSGGHGLVVQAGKIHGDIHLGSVAGGFVSPYAYTLRPFDSEGRYMIGSLIGKGGMSSVFEGQDLITGNPVAIKVLSQHLAPEPQASVRFQREVGIARRLRHRNIVRSLAAAANGDGTPALVMELLHGPTLRDVLRDGPLPAADATLIAHQLAGAFVYLSDQDIVRLDLKPSNIIITAERGPVIVDLGLARDLTDSLHLTDTGVMIGTPLYMAPEAMIGKGADARSDIYTFGLVVYECLTGRKPWPDLPTSFAVMSARMEEPADLSPLSVSPELTEILERCLQKDPDQRFSNPTQLLKAIEGTPEWCLSDNGG